MERYHDDEWGIPVRGDRAIFEKMTLEVFQTGLSWRLILHKREVLREVFEGFDPGAVARLGPRDVERLMGDARIVRHRGKIEATIENARRLVEIRVLHGGFRQYLDAVGPGRTAIAAALRRDFRYMGPSVIESFLQELGRLPVRHQRGCFLYRPPRPRRRPRGDDLSAKRRRRS